MRELGAKTLGVENWELALAYEQDRKAVFTSGKCRFYVLFTTDTLAH
jgi:hypothetical protein